MAPEQLEGGGPTPRVRRLRARHGGLRGPRRAQGAAGALTARVAHEIRPSPPDLRDAWPDAPPAAAEVLKRGMARDPERRPESACDLASELARALGEETTARDRLDAARAATGGALVQGPAKPPEPSDFYAPFWPFKPAPRPATPAPRSRAPDPPSPRRPSPPAQSRRAARLGRGVLIAAVAGLAVVVIAVVLASTGGDASDERGQPVDAGGTGTSQGNEGGGSDAPSGSGAGGTAPSGAGGSGSSDSTSATPSGGGAAEGQALNRQGFALVQQGKSRRGRSASAAVGGGVPAGQHRHPVRRRPSTTSGTRCG